MLYIYGPSFVGLVLMVLVYLFIGKMHFLDRRDGLWLDFLAGIAVAYVFVDILPHLAGKQEKVDGVPLEVVELTGAPGDVWLMDLWVLHTRCPNESAEPRLMLTQRFLLDAAWERLGSRVG